MVHQYREAGKPYPKISKPTPINANGYVIDQVADGTFRKYILRAPKVVCFDRSTLRNAAGAGDTHVEVYDRWSLNGTTAGAKKRVAVTNQAREDLQMTRFAEPVLWQQ